MRYKIELSSRAKRDLRLVPKYYKSAIRQAYKEICEDPFIYKELHDEFTGYYAYRVSVYRIVYKVFKKDRKVQIYTIGHRAIVYINDRPIPASYFLQGSS